MEAKDKAAELVEKFSDKFPILSPDSFVLTQAKQCAIIAVDEILSNMNIVREQNNHDYWQEVKIELEKL